MAGFAEIHIDQGSTFSTTINVNDASGSTQNLVGYSARSMMRKSYYSSSANNFTVEITNPANGEISISMTAANTANLKSGRYVYDLEMESPSGVVTRIVEGIVIVLPNVTR